MSKQYRRELRDIQKQLAKTDREQLAVTISTEREIARIVTLGNRQIRALLRHADKLAKGAVKRIKALQRREAILIGRLAS